MSRDKIENRVLIFDDSAVEYQEIGELYRQMFEVKAVSSPMQAIAALNSGNIDVLMTDLHFEGDEGASFGIELAKLARRLDENIPIIVYSGSLATSDVEESIPYGMQLLSKEMIKRDKDWAEKLVKLVDARRANEQCYWGSAFISYGGPDAAIAEAIESELSADGITTWLFSKDAVPGEKLHRTMADGVNQHDRVILLCSKHSLVRPGVLNEIERVLEKEARMGGSDVLIPLTIDDFVFQDWQPVRKDIAEQVRSRVIARLPDFTAEPAEFRKTIANVKKALKLT